MHGCASAASKLLNDSYNPPHRVNSKPIYLQIADGLMDDIQAGRYPADDRIPSVRDVAAGAQVNVNTAMRTFEYLEREGIIYNKRGIGYFVSPEAPDKIRRQLAEKFYAEEMGYFFARLKQIGMDPVELLQRYETYLNLKKEP